MDLLDLIEAKTGANLPFPPQPHVSSEKKDLLRRMIQVDVNKRITWEQLYSILPENRSILAQTDQIEDGSICLCLQIDHSLDELTDSDLKQSLFRSLRHNQELSLFLIETAEMIANICQDWNTLNSEGRLLLINLSNLIFTKQ